MIEGGLYPRLPRRGLKSSDDRKKTPQNAAEGNKKAKRVGESRVGMSREK